MIDKLREKAREAERGKRLFDGPGSVTISSGSLLLLLNRLERAEAAQRAAEQELEGLRRMQSKG